MARCLTVVARTCLPPEPYDRTNGSSIGYTSNEDIRDLTAGSSCARERASSSDSASITPSPMCQELQPSLAIATTPRAAVIRGCH